MAGTVKDWPCINLNSEEHNRDRWFTFPKQKKVKSQMRNTHIAIDFCRQCPDTRPLAIIVQFVYLHQRASMYHTHTSTSLRVHTSVYTCCTSYCQTNRSVHRCKSLRQIYLTNIPVGFGVRVLTDITHHGAREIEWQFLINHTLWRVVIPNVAIVTVHRTCVCETESRLILEKKYFKCTKKHVRVRVCMCVRANVCVCVRVFMCVYMCACV